MATVRIRLAGEYRLLQPKLAAQFEAFKAAVDIVNAAHHRVRVTLSDLVIFTSSVGSQAERPTLTKKLAAPLLALFLVAIEVDFALPGLRYAIGHFGDLPGGNPFADPTGLLGAVGIAVASLMLATAAGIQLARAERGVLSDPDNSVAIVAEGLPVAVTDPHGRELLGPNPAEDLFASLEPDAAAPLRVVGGAEADQSAGSRILRTGTPADHMHLFRDSRRRSTRLCVAAAAIVLGCGLWGCNGVMRMAALNEAARSQTAPPATSILGVAVTSDTSSRETKLSSALEPAIIGVSEVVFLLIVISTAMTNSAVGLREQDLERRVAAAARPRKREVKHAMKVIADYEQLRVTIAEKRVIASEHEALAVADEARPADHDPQEGDDAASA